MAAEFREGEDEDFVAEETEEEEGGEAGGGGGGGGEAEEGAGEEGEVVLQLDRDPSRPDATSARPGNVRRIL